MAAPDALQSPTDPVVQPRPAGVPAPGGARADKSDRVTPGGELATPPTHEGAEVAAAEGEEA